MSERDSLKELIRILQEADRIGFSSRSSPVQPLLDLGIDLFLLLANVIEEGSHPVKNNPELVMPKDKVDVLNNPLMLWIKSFSDFRPKEPALLAAIMRQGAREFVRLKRDPNYLPFAGFHSNSVISQASHFYHRRRQDKKHRSPSDG